MPANNNHVVITGASSGIGAQMARILVQQGSTVTLIARRLDRLSELANELNQKMSSAAQVVEADLSDGTDRGKIVKLIKSRRVDALINNAGFGSFGHFEDLNIERENEMVAVNIIAPQVLSHAVIPQMKARRSGQIINVASIAALQPIPYMASYAATKAFLLSFSYALRLELAPFNVGVTSICPGPTATEFGGVARVPGEFTNIHRDTVEMVVEVALRAARANRGVCVPGLRSFLLSLPSRILPLSITTKVTEWALRGAIKVVEQGK